MPGTSPAGDLNMKKIFFAVLLLTSLSPSVTAQRPNEPAQTESIKIEPSPLAAKYAQPQSTWTGTGGGRYDCAYDAKRTLTAFEMGVTGPARDRAEEILKWVPKPSFDEEFFARGTAYYILGKYDEAIAELDRAIGLKPQYADAYNSRGRVYSGKGDYVRALADCDKAVELSPGDMLAHYSRGRTYADKGDYDRAVADYSEVIRIEPDFIAAYRNRAAAYEKLGDKDKAQADRNKADEIGRQLRRL